jgi:amino acid transporter
MLPIYIATNVALFFFIRKNYASEFNWVLHALFPAIAVLVFLAALISDLYPFPAAPLNVFPYVTAAWIVIGVAWMLFLRRRSPEKVELIGRVVFQDTDVEPRDLGPDVGKPLVESPAGAWPKP